jgi:outer membrane protein assembly factor BamA
MHFRAVVFLVIASTLGMPAIAQKKPAPRKAPATTNDLLWKLVSIKITGSQRYTNDEIISGTGLQIGKALNEDDFKKATEQLGQTGLFANAAYSYTYSSEGAKLNLQLADNDQLVPARFDNFVWLSDKELLDQLRIRVPLFKGLLPLGGDMADQVSDALQALTIEHKIQGKADYIRFAKNNGPIESYLFTISGHPVRIQSVTFTGAGEELPLLQEEAKRLSGGDYTHTLVENEERLGFRPIYLQRGHLKAGFEEGPVKIARDGETETAVDVAITVTPGLQYKLVEIGFDGYTAFPAEQLRSLLRLKIGEPANAVELDKDLTLVARLYGTKGYMAPMITPSAVMDDSASTVHYDIHVREGDVYKMGELEIRGMDEKTKKKLVFDWKLEEGQVYDSSYVSKFLAESTKDLPTDIKWITKLHEAVNDDKTVDVTLSYEAKTVN